MSDGKSIHGDDLAEDAAAVGDAGPGRSESAQAVVKEGAQSQDAGSDRETGADEGG